MMRRSAAFTLIEMMAVIVLIALLAGAVAWSMTGELRRSTREDVIGELRQYDQMARLTGKRLGRPCSLVFDLDQQRVRRVVDPASTAAETAAVYALPEGVAVDRLVVADLAEARGRGDDRGTAVQRHNTGEVSIDFGTAGRGASYAVRLADTDSRRWLVFSGMTGQMMRVEDDQTIDNLFASLEGGGLDAD